MRTLAKQILSMALILCLCLPMLLHVLVLRADAALVYDPDAAVTYAAVHATDTPEIAGADCANFVSKCVSAGGIPVSEKVCRNLMLALKPYAAKVTNLEIVISNGYGRVPTSGSNTSILSKGDVMFVCCERCKQTGNNYERHAVIYSGESDANGYAKCYAHTSMANNSTFWVGYNGTYACSNGHATSYLAAEVVHFEYTVAPDKPTITTTTAYYAEGSNISISWNAVAGNTYYWINIYKDGALIVNQSMGNQTSYTLMNAAEGEYEFAVSANNSVGTSGGTSYSFLVGVVPEAPTIITTTTYYPTGTNVTVNWNAVLGNTYYWVNIYKDEKLIVNESAGDQTSFTFETVEAGEYKFVVSANNGAGNKGSAQYLFLVGQVPETPVLSAIQTNYDVGDSVTISWEPVLGNVYYWITAYKDGEIIVNQTLGNLTSYSVFLAAEGQYTIYISANNGAGTSGSAYCKFIVGNIQYTVIYDANGGTNAPESQTKIHGEDLVLSNSKPTRSGYTFLGWATSSTATSATYQPGTSFAVNADTTLYAVWKQGCENDIHSCSYKATKTPTTSTTGTLTGTCSKCKGTTTVTLPKLNTTDYSYAVKTSETCTAAGTGRYTWKTTTYGSFYFDVAISAKGHSYTNKVTASTCTAQGYTTHTCACGHSYKDTYTNATGHSYSYKVSKAPTTSATGTLTGTCSKCKGTATITLPKLGTTDYSYRIEKAPTYTQTGVGRYTWQTTTYGILSFDITLDKLAALGRIVVQDGTTAPGGIVSMTVELQNNPGIAYLAITPVYDASAMTLVGVENGEVIEDFDHDTNFTWSASENSTKDGLLLKVTFAVDKDAAEGEYMVDLKFREAYTLLGDDVEFTIEAGTITVSNILYGDANGDEIVNGKDVLLLRRYMANYDYDTGASTIKVCPGGDANGDGVINGKDVLLMRRYMANYDYDTGMSTIILGPN